jgi:hypothetical protein
MIEGFLDNPDQLIFKKFASRICMADGFADKHPQWIFEKLASNKCMAEGFVDNHDQLILSTCSEKGYLNCINKLFNY